MSCRAERAYPRIPPITTTQMSLPGEWSLSKWKRQRVGVSTFLFLSTLDRLFLALILFLSHFRSHLLSYGMDSFTRARIVAAMALPPCGVQVSERRRQHFIEHHLLPQINQLNPNNLQVLCCDPSSTWLSLCLCLFEFVVVFFFRRELLFLIYLILVFVLSIRFEQQFPHGNMLFVLRAILARARKRNDAITEMIAAQVRRP